MGEEHRQRPQRTRRGFTEEFKRDAVELVRSTGRPIAVVARELGIYDSTLGNWVRQDRIDRGEREGLTGEERARLRRLEAENTRLRMERDLLKRTVAFWSKRRRRREPLPLRRCPEGRRVPRGRRLPGGWGLGLGLLRLVRQQPAGAIAGRPQGGRAGRRDPHDPPSVQRDLRVAAGARRAASAWPEGQPQAGGAADGHPRIVGHRPRRRSLTKPDTGA